MTETRIKEMELGDLDLEGLEVACYENLREQIPPQQVSLLEKEFIKEKTMKFLGITFESLKDLDGVKRKVKRKNKEGAVMCK